MTKPAVGDWVRTPEGIGLVTLVEEHHLTLPVVYGKPVHVQFNGHVTRYSYEDAKRVSFLGFVFNGPLGWMGFGQNSIFPAAAVHLLSALMFRDSLSGSLSREWSIFVFMFAIVLVGTLWYMTWRNYKRKTV